MTKFKVGDKVRRTASATFDSPYVKTGGVYTVSYVNGGGGIGVAEDVLNMRKPWYTEDFFELVSRVYDIGDRVYTTCTHGAAHTGTVTGVATFSGDVDGYDLRLDDGEVCYSYPRELSPTDVPDPNLEPEPEPEPVAAELTFIGVDFAVDIARVAQLLKTFVEALNLPSYSKVSDLEWRLEDGGVRAYLYGDPMPWLVKYNEDAESFGLVIA